MGLRLRPEAAEQPSTTRSWASSTAWWPRPGASWTRPALPHAGEDGLPADAAAAEALLGAAAGARGAVAERPERRWNETDDPVAHCLAGNSLLLTGLRGRKDAPGPDDRGEAAQAGRVRLVSKTHCSAQNLALGAQTADHWVCRYVCGGSAQRLDWLVAEEITQLDMALWADLRGAEQRREVLVAGQLPTAPCWTPGPGHLAGWLACTRAGDAIRPQNEELRLITTQTSKKHPKPRKTPFPTPAVAFEPVRYALLPFP